MSELPIWIAVFFSVTVLVTIALLHAAGRTRGIFIFLTGWTILQSALGASGFYTNTAAAPPRILLFGVLPTIVLIILVFRTRWGRALINAMDIRTLTWLHIVRIPVEVVLWLLVERGVLSPLMSVGGTNFDVLSGLSAPLIAVLAFRSGQVNRKLLLVWNMLCLLLLANVVITAAFGIPSPFQQHSFHQPNLAVLHFPFNLLPTVVVPVVLLAHLVVLRKIGR